jgi:hypothetical protein
MSDRSHDIVARPDSERKAADFGAAYPQAPLPDILLWKPSLADLLFSGAFAGAVLGTANAVLAHYLMFDVGSPWAACWWGAALGTAGGVLVVLFRRIVWGPDIGVEVGTLLGLLYGVVPGAAFMVYSLAVRRVASTGWVFVGFIMAPSMGGLLIGGVLDRVTEAVVAWRARRRARAKRHG